MPRTELERFEAEEERDVAGYESFDRIAFAERALSLVRPRGTTVAICEGHRRVRLERGRQWGRSPEARWAMLSIPPNASRRAILNAILTLAADDPERLRNVASSPYRSWVFDVLVDSAAE